MLHASILSSPQETVEGRQDCAVSLIFDFQDFLLHGPKARTYMRAAHSECRTGERLVQPALLNLR